MRTLVWAHRGASGYAPENTLESFQMAVELGADAIELDAQLTKDGEIVVIHDETLDRVSDGKGFVKDYTLQELKQLHFNRTFPEYQDAKIPTLKEVYELIAPTDLAVNLEFKTGVFHYPGLVEKCDELAKEFGLEERMIYSSFYHPSLMHLKEINPDAKIGFLYSDGWLGNLGEYCKRWGAVALHPFCMNVDEQLADDLKEADIQMNVWSMGENPDWIVPEMRRLTALGSHAIITNYPDLARKVVEE